MHMAGHERNYLSVLLFVRVLSRDLPLGESDWACHGVKQVSSLMGTLRKRLEALNGADMLRLHRDDGVTSLARPLAK